MPLQQTSGAASYDAFGGGVPVAPKYIEDYFSTWLTTGTGSGSQTITNGIDLSGKGGMVWWKTRNAAYNHYLFDTNRGATNWLVSNQTSAQETVSNSLTSFNSDGFTIGDQSRFNGNTFTDVAWSFAKAPKFFDVVTWTATGDSQTIPHNLGSVPGAIIVKAVSATSNWFGTFRVSNTHVAYGLSLNQTAAANVASFPISATSITATSFGSYDVADSAGTAYPINAGVTYVAYLFAHNAGGFGLSGNENVISCGSFTTNGSSQATVNLGYEPQWILVKSSQFADNWVLIDNMRGLSMTENARLIPNSSAAEVAIADFRPTATGFESVANLYTNATYIYIAIRRGPMKTPTTGTSVFAPITWTGNGTNSRVITGAGFTPDMFFLNTRNNTNNYWNNYDRLRGVGQALRSYSTSAETSGINYGMSAFGMDGHTLGDSDGGSGGYNQSSVLAFAAYFQRAPGFFDEVCYTGNGSTQVLNHNLGVFPQLVIVKSRSSGSTNWPVVYARDADLTDYTLLGLNSTSASFFTSVGGQAYGNNATTFVATEVLGNRAASNASGATYVAYLFATLAGVSRVGIYTGTGATQTINCGFTGGARFVLIKRTDSTGDWYVWDSARGIVAGNDPYLLLNSTAAEVTSTDYVDTAATGFELSSTAPAAINASGGTFLFLAIA